MIYIIILGVLSLLVNILLVWYIKKILSKLLFVSDNIGGLLEEIDIFTIHTEAVYNLETYYGDETLSELIRHCKDLTESIKKYHEIYALTNEGLDEELAEMEKIYEKEEAE